MTKAVENLIEKLRKDEQKFAQFKHDLAHALTPDEVQEVLNHSNEVWEKDEAAFEAERLNNIAVTLEGLAAQVRNGELPVPQGAVDATVAFEVAK